MIEFLGRPFEEWVEIDCLIKAYGGIRYEYLLKELVKSNKQVHELSIKLEKIKVEQDIKRSLECVG